MQTEDSASEMPTDANAKTQTKDSADETQAQTLKKDQGLVEVFQQLSFQDDEPFASTAQTHVYTEKIFSPNGHDKKSQRH